MKLMKHRSVALLATLALAACSGDAGQQGPQGDQGAQGPAGKDGANGTDATSVVKAESCEVCHGGAGAQHQALYNSFTDGLDQTKSQLKAAISSVVSEAEPETSPATYKWTMTFTLAKGGVPYVDAGLKGLKQKSYSATQFDPETKTFLTSTAFNFGTPTATANAGEYTVVKTGVSYDLTSSPLPVMVYAYFGDVLVNIPVKPTTHYALMDNVASVAKVYGGPIAYSSSANVAGCEKCHPKPYSKHGYRQAVVEGLPDFAACKSCHTDQRVGSDGAWYLLVDDPATYAAEGGNLTADQITKYAYTANVMNDTHNSHAFEFAYPQSMANCVTCHENKLEMILTDANFKLSTCKSCHPVTGVGGTSEKRAPALKDILSGGLATIHTWDLYTFTGDCNVCHKAGGIGKTFSQIHTGYNKTIYAADGSRYAASMKTSVGTTSFDGSKLTVTFNVSAVPSTVTVKPQVVGSLYGYNTKDFVVSGHSSQFADKTPNLEWAEGAVIRGTTTPANNSRAVVTPAKASAGNASWTAVLDLTTWASMLADGSVKRIEVGFLPDATDASGNSLAISGLTVTYDLGKKAVVDNTYGKGTNAIVDPAKCNACHDALGTTFHTPAYGSAGVVGCRLCHFVGSASAHFEMQSRSIDSFVHAVHSFQKMDIQTVDFADPVQKLEYEEHIDSTYPNFTILNCESCHNKGTYEAPDQSRSLPGILAASAKTKNWARNIGTVPSYVSGPASRACGSCHRAQAITEDDAGKLSSVNAHTASFSTQVVSGTGVWEGAVKTIMGMFK